MESASVPEPKAVPAYSNASLVFCFEAAFATENVLEESQPSDLIQTRTSVVAFNEATTSTINRSSVDILLQTLAPHLAGVLPQSTILPPPLIIPFTTTMTVPFSSLVGLNDLMEDFL